MQYPSSRRQRAQSDVHLAEGPESGHAGGAPGDSHEEPEGWAEPAAALRRHGQTPRYASLLPTAWASQGGCGRSFGDACVVDGNGPIRVGFHSPFFSCDSCFALFQSLSPKACWFRRAVRQRGSRRLRSWCPRSSTKTRPGSRGGRCPCASPRWSPQRSEGMA